MKFLAYQIVLMLLVKRLDTMPRNPSRRRRDLIQNPTCLLRTIADKPNINGKPN